MTNKALRKALLDRLKVTPGRLSQRVQDIKRKCPMTTEEATYCLAHVTGLRLDKFLPRDTVDRIRPLVSQLSVPSPDSQPRSHTPKTVIRTRELRIGKSDRIADPILPETILNEAAQMAKDVYPTLYIFENSVRQVIQNVMRKTYGNDWWDDHVPKPVRDAVNQRLKKEAEEAWHGKRGAHSIHYTDIDHLKSIVNVNWSSFKTVFPRLDWFSNLVSCMELSRNPVAHMNPIRKDDIDRVHVFFKDWQRQIAAKRALVSIDG